MDFQRWLRHAASELSTSESPKRDAEILLEHVTGKARTYLLAFGETALTAEQQSQLETLLARRKTGEPVAHLVGEREFWSLPLYVSAATLIRARTPSVWWSRRWRGYQRSRVRSSISAPAPGRLRWRLPASGQTAP